jgi:hypothetical protein
LWQDSWTFESVNIIFKSIKWLAGKQIDKKMELLKQKKYIEENGARYQERTC